MIQAFSKQHFNNANCRGCSREVHYYKDIQINNGKYLSRLGCPREYQMVSNSPSTEKYIVIPKDHEPRGRSAFSPLRRRSQEFRLAGEGFQKEVTIILMFKKRHYFQVYYFEQ